jgi:hypothetical protein
MQLVTCSVDAAHVREAHAAPGESELQLAPVQLGALLEFALLVLLELLQALAAGTGAWRTCVCVCAFVCVCV